MLFFIFISSIFIFKFRNEIKLFDKEQSPLAQVSSFAKNYKEPLFISSDLSIPAATVFYSGKQVRVIRDESPPLNTIPSLIKYGPKPFLLITQDWRLKADNVGSANYIILKKAEDYQLLFVN